MGWSSADFAIVGLMITSVAALVFLNVKFKTNRMYRIASGLTLAGALLLVYINLAVGLIGSEDNSSNVMYFALLGLLSLGAIVSKFRPRGLALTLLITALGQLLIPAIAKTTAANAWVLTILFAALWIAAGFLFLKSAAEPVPAT